MQFYCVTTSAQKTATSIGLGILKLLWECTGLGILLQHSVNIHYLFCFCFFISFCVKHILLQDFDGWISAGTLFSACLKCLKYTFFEHIIVFFQAISTQHSVKSEYIFPTAIWLRYEEITVKVNYPIQNQFSPEGFPKCFQSTKEIHLPENLCGMHKYVITGKIEYLAS